MTCREQAERLLSVGVSVLPLHGKGHGDKDPKSPAMSEWKSLQRVRILPEDIPSHWTNGEWIGAIGGAVSGHLEAIDFDIPGKHLPGYEPSEPPMWKPFGKLCKEHGYREVLESCVWCKTLSGGIHVVYRCEEARIEGNQKLAQRRVGTKPESLIETRGEGGYIAIFPSEGYEVIRGDLANIPVISAEDREFFLNACRSLNEWWVSRVAPESNNRDDSGKPGTDYNLRGPSIGEMLTKAGWRPCYGHRKDWDNFTRPDKDKGISGGVTKDGGTFHVFSSNAHPFESEKSYSKFAVYAILNHGGSWSAAGKDLFAQGYGEQRTTLYEPKRDGFAGQTRQTNHAEPQWAEVEDEDDGPTKISAVTAEVPKWLWEPYVRLGHINLIEGWGGAMKSTLQLAIAMHGGLGIEPMTGKRVEKFRTLYIARQDSPGEIRTKYEQLGGDLDYLDIYEKPFTLDPLGLQKLGEWIECNDYRMVCCDPTKNFLPPYVKAEFDNINLGKCFDAIRGVMQPRECAFEATRHFAGATKGKRLEDHAAGGQEWRNSARTQLVGFPHPDKAFHPLQAVYFPARGSLLAGAGDPFGIDIVGGEFSWVPIDCLDLQPFVDKYPAIADFMGVDSSPKGGKTGRPPSPEREACEGWLLDQLIKNGDIVYMKDGLQWCEAKNIGRDHLYNAARSMGLSPTETSEGRKIWER